MPLSLAGPGPEPARVKVIAVPRSQRNGHGLEVEGWFGKLRVEIGNVSSYATLHSWGAFGTSALVEPRNMVRSS
jgi:predicted dinucleotide-utilizing enzyme